MAIVVANKEISPGVFKLSVQGRFTGKMGQFYMLRAGERYPLLSRPISIFDLEEDRLDFLIQVAGEGTTRLSELKTGDRLTLDGPFGNGFPSLVGRIAFVGGGIGIAPFYYALREAPQADVYLGFSREPYMVEEFRALARGNVTVDVGGSILEKVDFRAYDTVIACGPHPMLRAVQRKQEESGGQAKVYVSLENRMACGIGACLVCSVKCKDGRKKACADGPVFLAEEVVFA
ncbi:dihydroorotate dehydrogenase electron transfer subunit [Paenibacillus barengoltzii]|uniref:dihydroorotate dehydrogenase electron transfer subunit n=1 Tax=Paenibacillus barengoltzii TaxID=343517 RepID=UPI002DBCA0FF|nr:dihydroorotate dehydrogenase electron transfer subunit [Paenibacillus barengoltzii]MEC2344074.1 dihydroorotate dehydrogenase electron transfer subunit [Paenibacillus barengoltzii]